jgi:hypothetical protein
MRSSIPIHKRALFTVAATAALFSLSGCPDWPRDNPADPTLCDPRCGVGARCWQGQCVPLSQDLGPDTLSSDAGPDAPVGDADLGAPDLQADSTPDTGPACPAGYAKMISGTGEHLTAVWGTSSNEVFAVGKKGTILRYDGSAWSAMTSGTSADLYAVWGTGAKDVYVAGDQGTLLRYDGTSWKAFGPASTQTIYGLWGAGGQLFAVGKSVIHQHDGTKWSTPAVAGLGTLFSVHGSSKTDVYAVGGMAVLHYDGATWSKLSVPGPFVLQAVWGANKTFIAVGHGVITGGPPPAFAATIEAGTLKSMGAKGKGLNAIWGSTDGASGSSIAKPGDVFAVGADGTLLYYDGSAWHPQQSGVIANLSGVWRSEDNHVFVVGELGTIVHGRGPWELVPRLTTKGLTEIWGDSTDIYVGGAMGTLLHHDGTSWKADNGGSDSISGLWGDKAQTLYIASSKGTTFSGAVSKRAKGGSWTGVTTAPAPLSCIWGSGSGTLVTGGVGLIHYQTPAAPTTWTTDTGPTSAIRGVWGSSDSDIYAVGKGQTFHFNGTAWSADSTTATTDDDYAVWGASATDLFVVGAKGTIKRGKQGSWVDMTSGVSSILIGAGGSSATDVYAVGQYGTILHYDGTTWTSTITGTSHELRDVHTDGKQVYVVGNGGTILRWCGK